jgi:hypothetical protein
MLSCRQILTGKGKTFQTKVAAKMKYMFYVWDTYSGLLVSE